MNAQRHAPKIWIAGGLSAAAVLLAVVWLRSPAPPPPKLEEVVPQARPQPPKTVREPAVAGQFYPDNKEALAQMISDFLAKVPDDKAAAPGTLRALVCPHAGYIYSGQTAAYSFKQLVGRHYKTVVVMGPSHHAGFEGVYVTPVDAFKTPLGLVALSPDAAAFAQAQPFSSYPRFFLALPDGNRVSPDPKQVRADKLEHSIEVELPFLQQTLKDFELVPMMLGFVDPDAVADKLLDYLDKPGQADSTLLVASSDLSHYHPYAEACQMDRTTVDAICALNSDEIKEDSACGRLPILTLLHIARQKGWQAKKLDYRNSGDVTGDKDRVVGYSAVAFYAPQVEQASRLSGLTKTGETPVLQTFNAAEQAVLLKLARRALTESVTNGKLPKLRTDEQAAKFKEIKGCFVTLTINGDLRGCIGHILPVEPLNQDIMDNACSAALRDPRFEPVKSEELPQIAIEVSVLTRPETLQFNSPDDLLKKLQPRRDGVVLRIGERQSTYLPQVWEQLPDKTDFLNHLAEKAGLNASAWRGQDVHVSIYHVQAFKE